MPRKRNRARVPGVLWRLYRHRARSLLDAITSLLSPPPALCRCDGRRCLGCAVDANSFLLRPDDPSDYRKLLEKCCVVVSENAPSVPFFVPPSGLPQQQIVKRTIEGMLHRRERAVSNALCYGYDRSKRSSPNVELLSCSSWCLLLSRVGDDFMAYLLRNTSIFLPIPHGKHHQVGGPLISEVCFDKLKCQPKFHYQTNDSQKRKRAATDDLTSEKRNCHIAHNINGSLGFQSNLGLTGKSSMQLTVHHENRNYDVSVSEVPKSTRSGAVTKKLDSEVTQGLNCITPRLGKRSRQFSWQRRRCKMQKQLTLEENSLNTHCNVLATNTDCLPASFQPNTTSLSYHEKPNLACAEHLLGNIFGFLDERASAQPMPCMHSKDSCLVDSGCLYHTLVKWFKHLIRRTRCCHHTKLLDKHCVFPSLDKHIIGRSSSRLKDDISETKVHKKSRKNGTKHCADAAEAIDLQSEAVTSYCPKSQVVSFIWAVSRSLLPSELLEFKNWNDYVHGIKQKLLEKWIFWYFSCLVVPLVQASFYVTESEHGKQDIYYYPKPVWEKLSGSTIACFNDWGYRNLDVMAVHNILRGRPFGFSKLRLQPKENGVRMVANLKGSSRMPLPGSTIGVQNFKTGGMVKHNKIKFEHYQSVNYVLHDAHTILKGILFKEPDKLGSSVFDYNDVYKKLCPFLVGQKKGSASMPSLFIVTSDVLKAFDYIDQDKLLGIMKNVLMKDEYSIKQYDQVVCTKTSMWVQKQFTMLDGTSNNGHTQFTSFASLRSRHSVFVNRVYMSKHRYLKQIMVHGSTISLAICLLNLNLKPCLWFSIACYSWIAFFLGITKLALWFSIAAVALAAMLAGEIMVVLGANGVGIPQGGVLSSLLCSIYYGHLEKHLIFPFLEKTRESNNCKDNNSEQTNCDDNVSSSSYMLMRYIDDILFISTSKKQAASFFSRLQRGFRGYNCYMNEKKFGVNFDVEQISCSQLNRVYVGEKGATATSFLRWSGLLINCSTMEIQADYSKLIFTPVLN
ncbi:hypothetical protein Fmac_018380 [Flemingia macrophylla]|uniref:Telomerase reverse transcriptase n=1 Tax=Flemingia macrophylla TaxID=520843 RepID=A0ABD1M4U1_9FABA